MKMSKAGLGCLVTAGVGLLAVLIIGIFLYRGYNGCVEYDVRVEQQWANVENVYQRRVDLIPNLVGTVKGAASFEKETLTGVMEARAKATQVTVDPANMTEGQRQEFMEAQNNLSGSLSRLLVSIERYPELKATEQFQSLMAQLEGTENRIAVERRKYNEAVAEYNLFLRRFPNNMIAGMFGFQPRAQFHAQEGADKAPKVDF